MLRYRVSPKTIRRKKKTKIPPKPARILRISIPAVPWENRKYGSKELLPTRMI
jgi:hypothetical protein